MGQPRLTDERLCWLAVRDELEKRTRNGFGVILARIFLAPRARQHRDDPGTVASGVVAGRMSRYALAVDDLADRLTREERARLRVTGEVPPWFVGAVEERAEQLKASGF